MLIVLAIVGIVTALALPTFDRLFASSLQHDAEAVDELLSQARILALSENATVEVRVNVATGLIESEQLGARHDLSAETTVELVTARSQVESGDVGRILFYPDGASSGAQLILRESNRTTAITIHWLTGKIQMETVDGG